jgi:GDP-L-fucose synthase
MSTNIIITGSSGFLGKNLIKQLKLKSKINIIEVKSKKYDLKKFNDCLKLLKRNHYLIHLAADAGGIGYNRKNSSMIFFNNLIMNTNLIEAARIKKIKKTILIGSVCSYPSLSKIPFKEEEIWSGYPEPTNAAYGLAKKMMLVQSSSYYKDFKMNFTNLIIANLYGPHDDFNLKSSHVIPAIIRKMHDAKKYKKKVVNLWGSGKATRDFTYVDDAANAIIKSLKITTKPDPINIGTGKEFSIKSLAKLIAKKIGFSGKIKWNTQMPDGQLRRVLSLKKSKKILKINKTVPLSDGVEKTINWYLKNNI